MDINVSDINNSEVDTVKIQKMGFIFNALENGWTIKKRKNLYIFTKNHEGKREVYSEEYLRRFIVSNFDTKAAVCGNG